MLFAQTFEVISPILLVVFIGFLVGRLKSDIDVNSIGALVLLVSTPSLVFSKLTTAKISLDILAKISTAALLCVLLAMVLGYAYIALLKMPVRTFLPCIMFPNSGNTGLPLIVLAYGEAGASLGISFFFVVAVSQFTIGLAISSGTYSLKNFLKQPIIYAVLFVAFFVVSGVPVPSIVAKTTDVLGGMMIPAMLILLGSSLATLKITDLKPAIVIALGRMAIGLVTGLTVIYLFELEGVKAGTVFLMSAMPATVVSYVFAQRYRPDPQQVAGGIVLSTLMTFLVLPALLLVAMTEF